MGIGDWGLGPIPNPQSPIPNPQSPIPKEALIYFLTHYLIIYYIYHLLKYFILYYTSLLMYFLYKIQIYLYLLHIYKINKFYSGIQSCGINSCPSKGFESSNR